MAIHNLKMRLDRLQSRPAAGASCVFIVDAIEDAPQCFTRACDAQVFEHRPGESSRDFRVRLQAQSTRAEVFDGSTP